MNQFSVAPEQVVWVPGSRHYIAESNELVVAYRARVEIPDGATIFSDQGNAFFRDRVPVLSECFGVKTATYPSLVHHYLSPNDNHYHGVAKAKWRAESAKNGWGKDDGVASSLCLLSFLNTVPPPLIQSFFTKNFMLANLYVDPERCMRIVAGTNSRNEEREEFFERARGAYRDFVRMTTHTHETTPETTPDELSGTLDGEYWRK